VQARSAYDAQIAGPTLHGDIVAVSRGGVIGGLPALLNGLFIISGLLMTAVTLLSILLPEIRHMGLETAVSEVP
jgi:hypothetical protein